ncbi:hypothetical protein Nepgr_025693 [Nepenthes gracilis]|uniref:Uncharacterized protein n=1 Tax=Nepenthes gracilis TaxID=150966 RepID=A0AAD3Y1D3_NEPGR|nr:hypothetical protein Nepgr_025693 [Nepenthes gracilis]
MRAARQGGIKRRTRRLIDSFKQRKTEGKEGLHGRRNRRKTEAEEREEILHPRIWKRPDYITLLLHGINCVHGMNPWPPSANGTAIRLRKCCPFRTGAINHEIKILRVDKKYLQMDPASGRVGHHPKSAPLN